MLCACVLCAIFLCVMCYERLFYVPCAHVLRGTRLHAVFYVLCAYVLCALGGPFATVLRVCARQRQHVRESSSSMWMCACDITAAHTA